MIASHSSMVSSDTSAIIIHVALQPAFPYIVFKLMLRTLPLDTRFASALSISVSEIITGLPPTSSLASLMKVRLENHSFDAILSASYQSSRCNLEIIGIDQEDGEYLVRIAPTGADDICKRWVPGTYVANLRVTDQVSDTEVSGSDLVFINVE